MNKEIFIEKHKLLWGNDYDYKLLPDEFENNDKIKIICKHGEKEYWAFMFLRKQVCEKCFYENLSKKRIQQKS